jgi:hypothetical protein
MMRVRCVGGLCVVLAVAGVAVAALPAVASTQTLDQSDTNQDGHQTYGSGGIAQIITAGASGKIYRLDLPLAQNLGATSVTVQIQTVVGSDPSGTSLASSTISAAGLPGTGLPIPFKTIRFATPANVTAGTQYAIVVTAAGGSGAIASDSAGAYAGGQALLFVGGIGWFGGIGDLAFKEYLGPFPVVAAARGSDHVFLCYSKFEHDGGEVVSVDQAPLLIAAGRWLPSAIAGVVAGGENHGAYHLDCNPPSTMSATGEWLGDGGDVVEGQRDDYYPIVS